MNWGAVTVLLIESPSELECESISTFILIDSRSAIRTGEPTLYISPPREHIDISAQSVCFIILRRFPEPFRRRQFFGNGIAVVKEKVLQGHSR